MRSYLLKGYRVSVWGDEKVLKIYHCALKMY